MFDIEHQPMKSTKLMGKEEKSHENINQYRKIIQQSSTHIHGGKKKPSMKK